MSHMDIMFIISFTDLQLFLQLWMKLITITRLHHSVIPWSEPTISIIIWQHRALSFPINNLFKIRKVLKYTEDTIGLLLLHVHENHVECQNPKQNDSHKKDKCVPMSISYIITPRDHQSQELL